MFVMALLVEVQVMTVAVIAVTAIMVVVSSCGHVAVMIGVALVVGNVEAAVLAVAVGEAGSAVARERAGDHARQREGLL